MRWLADENFDNDILRALFRREPGIDVVRAQDVGLTRIDDEALLAWAAEPDRVLLTHDVSTITAHAYRRVLRGEGMPGVFEVSCGAKSDICRSGSRIVRLDGDAISHSLLSRKENRGAGLQIGLAAALSGQARTRRA